MSTEVDASLAAVALRDSIVERVSAADPAAVMPAVQKVVASVAATYRRLRQLEQALAARPQALRDGRPPAPQVVGELLLALRRTRAAVVAAPACGTCTRALRSVRGSSWRCQPCLNPPRECAVCGRRRTDVTRDQRGRWCCPRCRPAATPPDWAALVATVVSVDPTADPQLVLAAAHQAAPRLAQQRSLVATVTGNPDLLHGGGAAAPAAAVFRLINLLAEAGVDGMIRPACPRCARVVALVKWLDGERICQRCDRQVRAAPCARCGRSREINTRDPDGQPICGACRARDPANVEPCVRCGHRRPVNNRTAEGPICTSCATPAVRLCGLCGRTAPSHRSTLTGQARCRACAARRLRCGGCGQVEAPHSGTLADPRCLSCTVPEPGQSPRHRACPTCGRPRLSASDCVNCCLNARVRALLTVEDEFRPELWPLLAWWKEPTGPPRFSAG